MDSKWHTNKCVFAVVMTVFVINAIWNNGNENLKSWFEKEKSREFK
jgi:hypothetical protein